MHSSGFIGGGCNEDGFRGLRCDPDAGQRSLGIACRNPLALQANGIADQMQLDLHGSSSLSPNRLSAPDVLRRNPAAACGDGLLVREDESGSRNHGLTRSIHGLYAVKSVPGNRLQRS